MMFPAAKNFIKLIFTATVFAFASFICLTETRAETVVQGAGGKIGTIKGVVRDEGGNPIADAFVAVFRVGTSKLLKQVRSAADGSYVARVIPGTYTVLAVAQGYNPVTLATVEVDSAASLVFGFKLERSGGGNTLPEKRVGERNNPKNNIRAAQISRSIYQNREGDAPIDETAAIGDDDAADDLENYSDEEDQTENHRRGQTVVETYFADTKNGSFTGVNFATKLPVGESADAIVAGQIAAGQNAPMRLETDFRFRAGDKHQISLNAAVARLGKLDSESGNKSFGQISFQATDQWSVREGIVLVLGLDYSRFIGAGNDFSLNPRIGLQYDINSKTRFRSAFTTQTEKTSWQDVIDLEGAPVAFREPVAVQDFVIEKKKPLMNKSSRMEFGIERVLDNRSSVEGNVFFDTTINQGVGLVGLPFNALNGADFQEFIANRQGDANGFRVVYNRRFNGIFSTAAGYAFGSGQKISEDAPETPGDMFEDGLFQTFFGQIDADFNTGTKIKAIFRFSPQATVFAIDPFQGRLAIYDPGLSVLVTQSLPTLGLPIHAQAVVDARNLFDFQGGVNTEQGVLRVLSGRRNLRGGISVRF